MKELLLRSPLFAAMPDAVVAQLAQRATRRRVKPGRIAHDATVIVLLTGRIEVIGDGAVVRSLVPPATIGVSVAVGAAATAELRVAEESEVVVVPADAVLAALRRHPEVAMAAIAQLASVIGELSAELAALRTHGIEARVLHRLRQLGRGRREIAITHAQLAEEIGGERANVSRALAKLERDGVLVRRRGRIELVER